MSPASVDLVSVCCDAIAITLAVAACACIDSRVLARALGIDVWLVADLPAGIRTIRPLRPLVALVTIGATFRTRAAVAAQHRAIRRAVLVFAAGARDGGRGEEYSDSRWQPHHGSELHSQGADAAGGD